MANKIYPKYKKAAISGGSNHDLIAGSVKLVMVDTGAYTYSDTHEFLSDIPSGARIAQTAVLGTKAVSDGAVFSSANSVFPTVTGASVEAVVMFIDTGSPATSRLVAYWDTGITGLPVTPSGASYNVIEDTGAWFTL